jgi:YbgC/YbaW family acyl-CoA thioester hydrolase
MSSLYSMPIRVHWPDTDPAGIVWFGHFFRYFEEAEEELFRALGRDRNSLIEEFDIWMPRVELACRFRSPARLGDLIAIGVGIETLTDRRLTYRYEFTNGERLLADGSCRVACVDRRTFKGREFPEALIALLNGIEALAARQTASSHR